MNKEESLRLYAQGKENWNLWAKRMLARREDSAVWKDEAGVDFTAHVFEEADFSEFIFPGEALFEDTTFNDYTNFQEAIFAENASFLSAIFKGYTEFGRTSFKGHVLFKKTVFEDVVLVGATFEGSSFFDRANFKSLAGFRRTTFKGRTVFAEATFKDRTVFAEATFNGHTMFAEATFKVLTEFSETIFKGRTVFAETIFAANAKFDRSLFESYTSFEKAIFHAGADFKAVQGNSEFTMAEAAFMEVPDFQQATFVQAPRLDNVKVGPQLSRWDKLKAFFTKGDLEKGGRWRALKRLATQGHDHASEQRFFRGELLARRGVTDRYWHASFWLGVFYQLFSDFGRSLIRPLLWWAAGMLVFAGIYLSHHPGSGGWWLLECIAGSSTPWVSALGLSVHKSLPAVSGFGFGDKLPQFHACLYGVESENPFRPIIPDGVAFLGVLQVLFSAVMIFLFLLAVRNHFRIR